MSGHAPEPSTAADRVRAYVDAYTAEFGDTGNPVLGYAAGGDDLTALRLDDLRELLDTAGRHSVTGAAPRADSKIPAAGMTPQEWDRHVGREGTW